jgi:3-phytase
MRKVMRAFLAVTLFLGLVAVVTTAQQSPPQPRTTQISETPTVRPEAKVQTVPVPSSGDAADDPAIWIHPTDPERSLILGTNKNGGLHLYNMDGSEHQLVADGSRPNNVDVLYDFKLGDGTVDLAMASLRNKTAPGIKVWVIHPDSRQLTDVTEGGVLRVMDGLGGIPYGYCTYRSKSGASYFFVSSKKGRVEQYLLEATGKGTVNATKVRTLGGSGIREGLVADHELGYLYVAHEAKGIFKYGAEPDAGTDSKLVAKVGKNGLEKDVEGLTIYYASGGKGYLIASSQSKNHFTVYTREGDNRFVLTIDPKQGAIDDVIHTDGIDVTNRPTSKQFPQGVFVAQDHRNSKVNQNFKLYAWEDIAGKHLLVDTKWSPRQ